LENGLVLALIPAFSPRGEGESCAGFLKYRAEELAGVALSNQETDDGIPSPWGEGKSEGSRDTNLPERDYVGWTSRSAWWGEAANEPGREDARPSKNLSDF
jgi:hypothetical protein